MISRRELVFGTSLFAAAGASYALTPRKSLNLLGKGDLEKLVPMEIGSWSVSPSNAVILPEAAEGSLADQLYSQTVSRLYMSESRLPVMLVIAYGDTQSDQLQLHRPEACYSAVGFEVSDSRKIMVSIAEKGSLPARAVVARSRERVEPILYWTRIGDYLPASGNEQRLMKLRTEMDGYVADGVLVRLSTVAEPTPESFDVLEEFARLMLQQVAPQAVQALVGRPLAKQVLGGQV